MNEKDKSVMRKFIDRRAGVKVSSSSHLIEMCDILLNSLGRTCGSMNLHDWRMSNIQQLEPGLFNRGGGVRKKKMRMMKAMPSSKVSVESYGWVMSKAFLDSYEWKQVRMMALKRDGAKCLCCGATPASGEVMNADHIKPRKTHPELALDLENIQILCSTCNAGKLNWDTTDWRKK